jgi:hypothetical protein
LGDIRIFSSGYLINTENTITNVFLPLTTSIRKLHFA